MHLCVNVSYVSHMCDLSYASFMSPHRYLFLYDDLWFVNFIVGAMCDVSSTLAALVRQMLASGRPPLHRYSSL